jgi:2-polyprenyl-6-methoxyphenol hydroxylase-like FAD-dependent oxidoreductase
MGDAIIGADGANGVIRRVLLEEEDKSPECDVPAEIMAYRCFLRSNNRSIN